MTRIYDDPADFKDEVIDGFAVAYSRYVAPGARRVRLRARRRAARPARSALVIGGGSGHYPSYSGVTGPGFADGCVLGDVFTSPSARAGLPGRPGGQRGGRGGAVLRQLRR